MRGANESPERTSSRARALILCRGLAAAFSFLSNDGPPRH